MANEYGELEQLVNDVTSLDTARMTLRWALERLQNIEKEKADLKKNLTLAEETAKRLQLKESSLRDAYDSRNKTIEEKEDFYTKLEATMSLLGEGKLDVQQLLKKEAKLDSLRRSLETEYQEKFEELDRSQRAIMERWNARLLDVESQYAGRLSEAQKKYDSLRAELDAEHQGRLTALQASFKAKEKEFGERLALLEGNVRSSEERVETRRRELEAEYLSKKRETEENYRKLRSMLESGLEEKIRAADSDHAAQVSSLQASWQAERSRLLEEQRVREEQFLAAQDRIKEIENNLAAQQEAHHSELLKIISEKETAFRAQLAGLEKEKAAKESSVRELSAVLEKRAAGWEAEKAVLRADFDARLSAMDAALKEREAGLEKDYAARKAALSGALTAERGDLARELESRVARERAELAAERAGMAEAKERLEAALAAAAGKIKELENNISSMSEAHRGELMARVSAAEASFREKLAAFETERRAYNESIKRMEEEVRARDAAGAADRQRLDSEAAARASVYEGELAALAARLEAAAREAAVERERHGAELARVSAEAAAKFEERSAGLKAGYEAMAARIKADSETAIEVFKASFSASSEADGKNRDAERSRLEQTLEQLSGQFRDAQVEIVELNTRLRKAAEEAGAREAALTGEVIAAKASFDREFSVRVKEAVLAQSAALVEAMEALKDEKTRLEDSLQAKHEELRRQKEESQRSLNDLEARMLADFTRSEEDKRAELARVSAEAAAKLEERSAGLKAGYEAMAARIKADSELAIEVFKASFCASSEADGKNRAAERARLEQTLEQLSSQFQDAQVEIVELNTRLRKAAEEAGARETALTGEVISAKAALDREFSSKVKETVLAQTADLVEAMETLKAEKAGLSDSLQAKHEELMRLKEESQRSRSDLEARILADFTRAEEDRRVELEGSYAARQAALEDDFRARRAALEDEIGLQRARLAEENAALKSSLEKISAAAAAANARSAELAEKLLAAEKNYHAEKLEMQKAYAKELDDTLASTISSTVENYEARLHRTQEELAGAKNQVVELSEKLLAAEKEHHSEKLGMQTEHVREAEASISEAVAAAVEVAEQRLRHAQDELAKARKEALEEAGSMEADFAAEKDRLLEEMDRRDRYIESAEAKMQELEREMLRYRQDSSSELMRNISEQDKRFRDAAAEEKARTEARVKQLEDLLEAKEKLLADSDRFCRQKQLELDKTHAELNQRLSKFNDELYAQKQALSEREQSLSDYRLKLEKEYSIKAGELEQMKAELTRAIMDYKGRK